MKKIITAINNPNLNKKLNEENNIEIICKDIQYKDAIIDILNKNKNVDIIIINEKIPGEINNEKLINKIKEINKKIRIIFILEKQNKKLEILLKENNINDIYYNNEINFNKIIELINYGKINIKSEINEVKFLNKNIINNLILFKDKIFNKKNIFNNNNNNKIITISGPPNVGKTNFIINLFKIINNKKILIIDFDLNKQNIYSFLGIKKYSKKINKKIISKNININYLINYFLIKLNKNKFLISGVDLLFDFLDKEKFQNFFQEFFNYIKNNYDLILFDIGSENNIEINNIIFKNSDINVLLIEGNLIGINKFKKYIEKNNYNNNNLNIIINKKDKYCVDEKILNNIFNFNILGSIKYNKIYDNLINNNYKNNLYLLKIKNEYKKEYIKIYKKI